MDPQSRLPWTGFVLSALSRLLFLHLILGFLGRFAAGGLFIIFAAALVAHLPYGWMMNWFGKRSGEGTEYHVMLLSLLLVTIIQGSGAGSVDLWLTSVAAWLAKSLM